MIRGITMRGAVSLNVITMIGIGPLITIPLVLQQLAGPLALAGWVAGALVALCDGLVWAELGSRYPGAGGTYAYLREVFGAERWGRLFAFLFNWQFFLSSGLTIATGYIGFAQYAGYLYPPASANWQITDAIAAGIGLVTIAFVYRRITAVANFGTVLAAASVLTLVLVGAAGFSHGDVHRIVALGGTASAATGFITGLGSALFITLYDYGGYAQIAFVGEEVQRPQRTLPLSIVAAILLVLVLYLFLQTGVLAGIPWQTLFDRAGNPTPQAQYVGATVVAHAWGAKAAAAVTAMVLVTAFASLYGNLVGAARVPFAAARDGVFLPWFARLHPTKRFPHVALLAIGAISIVACFFKLIDVIAVLSAAGILTGSIAQIAALFVLRARGERAPFRMWLFPLPAIVALAGWCYAFESTGARAILLGMAWLFAGAIVYLVSAARRHIWPFAAAAFLAAVLAARPPAQAAPERFVYGAAFFYERIPRAQWAPALEQYRAMGVNTIDLYVMWNWHEPHDGEFDFTGRTNPRRDLLGLLRLIHRDNFKIILRPGPVIRNEWRNGGYPAWLLTRPEYRMPLRDVLEGRYPATATLQNAHSDAAAAEWMRNATHMRYAARWLRHVFTAVSPWKRDVIAVALDDDQGAYLDNDTWPGANFHRYMEFLRRAAQQSYGAQMPVFINTYQMKVTASAPVWAWGNWYQSDTYSIGEHDRAQIEFSTGLLQTQSPRRPIMVSEFQAGWLQGADQAQPRAADPTNTTLALHTFLQMGAHGIVNFPVQDTFNPSGWEAPWTNAFYSWDAALSVQLTPQARWAPTARFGALMARYGSLLVHTHPAADAAIAYMTSAYDPRLVTSDDVAAIASATVQAQAQCRAMRLTCALVDLRYDAARLREYAAIVVPSSGVRHAVAAPVETALARYRAAGGEVVYAVGDLHVARSAAGGIPNATLLVAQNGRYAFLDVVNYASAPLKTGAARVHAGSFSARVPALTVAPRDALLLPLNVSAAASTPRWSQASTGIAPSSLPLRAGAYIISENGDGAFDDGYPQRVFQSDSAKLVVSLCSGARAFVFEDRTVGDNLFTTIGGMRDAWTPELPPSPRDYIAKYTHPIATGTFNRCYAQSASSAGTADYSYTAPDAPGGAAHFEKHIAFAGTEFEVSLSAAFAPGANEHAQQLTSFALPARTHVLRSGNGYALYEPVQRRVVMVSWPRADAVSATLDVHPSDALLTVTFAAGARRSTRFGFASAKSLAQAQARFRQFANRPGP
jgi:amino acid transporter